MKSKKQSTAAKVLSLAIIMIFTLSFVMGFVGSSANVYAADGDTVTRAEWLSMLAKTFEMTVEEEDYPDNYFSDLDETSEYYKDILLNVEFGVVDVEAGDPVYPDEPVTREFAAQTLNYCLAFKLEEETEYTFSDVESVKNPMDVQVAIDRGWFTLIDGAFSPTTLITKAEADAMMADAEEVWHSTDYEEGHVDQVEFKEGITDLTKETTYLLEDGSLVLINGSGKVNVGDKVALDVNGIPCVISVETAEVNGNDVIIDGTYLDNEDAYADVDVQGSADGSSIIFGDPGEGVEVEYEEVEQPTTKALRKISGSYNLNENRSISLSKEFKLGEGAKLKFKAKLKNSKIEYALRLKKESYIKFSTDTDFTASCAVDLAEATGMNEFPVLPATVPGVGGFDIIMEFSLGGELSAKASGNLVVGVAFDPKDKDFRMIKSFKAKDFSIEIEASALAGLKARLGVTGSLLPLNGYVYAEVGVTGTIKTSKYSSGTPTVCTTFASYLYANAGCEISYTLGFKKYKYKDEYEMYNEDNSPLRVYHHYEDKKEVPRCTRGDEGGSGGSSGGDHNFKYFTPVTSKHWSSGWKSGSGSKGYTRAAEPVVIWEYELDEKYNAKLTSYKGNATALTIPSKIDGYTVTGIGNNLFKGNTMLTYVGMPDTIETVGEYAFNNCTNLRTVKLSDALTEIGYRAFMGCTSLEDIDLPDGLVTIKGYAFNGCTSLRKLDIPDSVTDIEYNVFQNCSRVREIKLSKKLVHIGAKTFSGTAITSIEIPKSLEIANYNGSAYSSNGPFTDCSELKTVTFEEGTTKVARFLLAGCNSLESIVIPDTVTTIDEHAFYECLNLREVKFSSALTTIEYRAFMGCTSLEELNLPDGLVTIKGYAFNGCTSLKKLNIPDSVTDIEYNVFQNCTGITEIKLSKKLEHIGAKAFSGTAITSIEIPKSLDIANYNGSAYSSNGIFTDCSELKTVTFEEGTTKVARFLLAGCNSLESIVIPDTVTTIDEHAFYECLNLKDVKFSSALTTIAYRAFMGCTSLEDIDLPNGLMTIKGYAFHGCTSLKKVDIPDSVTDIEYNVFQNCTGITEIKLSKKLVHIGAKAFSGTAITSIEIPKSLDITNYNGSAYSSSGIFTDCSELKTVTFEEGTTKVARFLLAGCNSLESIVIPDTVTTIDEHAFYECLNLKDVKFSSALTTIEYRAFMGCTSLEELNLPDGLVAIKGYAFHGCTSLKKADIPDSVTGIAYNAFQNCSSMTDLKLSAGLKEIEKSTFNGCTGLVNITWNDSLEIINEKAFENCDALLEALIPGNVSKIGNYAFNDCDKLEKATVPDSVTNFGTYVFNSCDKLKDVTLGSGITTIPNYTFYECGNLEEIVIPYRVTKIGAYAFANDPKLVKVTIPRAVTTIDNTAFSYPTRMTIYGVSGTYAETFANEKGCTFVNQEINATSVKLSQTELRLNKGASATLIMTVEPSNFTDQVSWKSSDTNVVTVSDIGVVTAKGVGTATIKLVVGSVSASCKITVVQPVTSISINRTSLTMEALDTFQLTASVNPSNAEDKTITWETSDPAIATVDETGLVTALAKGTATITVKAMDGSGVTKECKVTVTNTAHVCKTVEEFESPHNYPDNCNDFWVYTQEGMTKLIVTFDERTNIEDGFDYLYIYDSQGNEIGKYTGKALAGKTIEVPGDTIKIKIVSDDSGNEWGFKVANIASDCNHQNIIDDPAVPATCTEPGLTGGSHCADCGTVIVAQEVIPALGHDWGEWTVVKAPTQDEEGLEERVCKNDPSHVEQRTIPKLDHNHEMVKTEGVEATCVDDGSIEYWTCSICHKMYSDEEGKNEITEDDIIIPAPGHDFEEIVTPATLTKNGSIVTKCTRCGKVKSTKKIYYPETFELSATEYVFDGKVKKPAVSIIDANGDEIKSTYYDVKYPTGRKNVGKYTVTITMKGNYTGTEKLTFKINPKGTTLKTLVKGSKAITVKWNKQSAKMASTRITGYQIQLATNSKFTKGKKSVTVSGYSKISKKVTGLKAKTTYYVRIRTYKTVSGTKCYSKWSAKKSVKTN